MNQHNIPTIIFTSIAIGSLAILLLVFSLTLDIITAIRFIVGFYGVLCLIAIIFYSIDQYDTKKINDYATKTKLYQDRLAIVEKAQDDRQKLSVSPNFQEKDEKTMREALDDIDDKNEVGN